jgi:cytochrome P450 family 6
MNGVGTKEHASEFMKREYDRFKHKGPAFGLFFLSRKTIVPTDPELVKEILVRSFENFHDHGFPFNEKSDPLATHLFATSGQVWKDLRAKLSPTFTSGRMKMMFPIVASKADRMIEYLHTKICSESTLDTKEVFASFTTESIASVAFGLETKVLGDDKNEFRKNGRRAFEPTGWDNLKMFIGFSFEKFAMMLNFKISTDEMIEFFQGTVRETLEYRQKNNVKRNDFFQLAMEVMENDKDFKFRELAANCFFFFLAG